MTTARHAQTPAKTGKLPRTSQGGTTTSATARATSGHPSCPAADLDSCFVIRRLADRFAGDGTEAVDQILAGEKVPGLHLVTVRDDNGRLGSTWVELSLRGMIILPPVARRKPRPALALTVLHARQPEDAAGRP